MEKLPQSATSTPTYSTDFLGVESVQRIIHLGVKDPRAIVGDIINISLGFLGIIFVLLVLKSGFHLLLSGGKEEGIQKAKRTFWNAVIGLIIILCARSIVLFVIQAFQNGTLPSF